LLRDPTGAPHPLEEPMVDAALIGKRRSMLLTLAGVRVLLTACAQTTTDGGRSEGWRWGGQDALTVRTTDKVTALDPAAGYDNGSSTVWTQVFGYLLNTSIGSEDGVPEPDLAASAEFTSENIYTVTLQEALTFANGNELTAEDVKH